jgi:hypothetical protein
MLGCEMGPASPPSHRRNWSCAIVALLSLPGCNGAPLDVIGRPPGDLADALVAHWTFDDGSGDVASDVSGNGHDGQLTGGVWITDGRFGGGLRFSGQDSVAVPNFPAATPNWSVSAWIRVSPSQLEANRGIGTVMTTENFYSNGWELNVDRTTGQSEFVFSYWSPTLDGYLHTECPCVPTNTWLHLAAVVDGAANHVTLYANGAAMDQQAKLSDILPGDSTLHFGRWNMEGRFLTADLDDVAVWGRSLTAGEIAALNNESPRSHVTATLRP